jgi:hypothetical protein
MRYLKTIAAIILEETIWLSATINVRIMYADILLIEYLYINVLMKVEKICSWEQHRVCLITTPFSR